MIRQRMRLIGRFLERMKKINTNTTDSVFNSEYIYDTRKAINIQAGLDEITRSFKTPNVAFNLGTLLKH